MLGQLGRNRYILLFLRRVFEGKRKREKKRRDYRNFYANLVYYFTFANF